MTILESSRDNPCSYFGWLNSSLQTPLAGARKPKINRYIAQRIESDSYEDTVAAQEA